MDRSKAPRIKDIITIHFEKAQKIVLDNGIPVFYIASGSQDIMRTDIVFDAGTWQQEKFFQAALTNSMQTEGTKTKTSEQIAAEFDFLGTFYGAEVQKHAAVVAFYSLKKFYDKSLLLIEDVLKNPVFPEKEFAIKLNQRRQNFLVSRQKVETLALLKFFEVVFGKGNSYGNKPEIEDFEKLHIDDLKKYHQQYYHAGNAYILMAGKNPADEFDLLNKHLGQNDWKGKTPAYSHELHLNPQKPGIYWHEKPDAQQSAIRAGFLLPEMDPREYILLKLFNMVYGGYFGSRLMQNLREDKGFTYGVSSFIREEKHAKYFMVATNVGKEYTLRAIDEMKKELDILLKNGIDKAEFENVKRQFLGDLLSLFDGVFAQIDAFDDVYSLGKDYSFYELMLETVKKSTPEEVMNVGRKYFSVDKMYFAVAGSK